MLINNEKKWEIMCWDDGDDSDVNIVLIFERKRKNFLNPYKFIHSAYELIKIKPDLLVVSLWRSCITAIIVKFFKPKTKIVLFLHYPHHYHFVDMFFTKLMSKLSLSIWADSQDTLDSRLPNYPKERSYIISFVARKLKPIESLTVFSNGLITSEVDIKYDKPIFKFLEVLNPVPIVINFLEPFNSCSLK